MRKLSTVQNGGFPNIFSFHIIHYTLFSSLKNICNKKDFHVARQTCWWKRPFHVGCQDKSGPGKIHEVILVAIWSIFNSWVRASVPRVIAGTKIYKLVTRSLVADGHRVEVNLNSRVRRSIVSEESHAPRSSVWSNSYENVHCSLLRLRVFFVANFLRHG